MKTDYNYCAKFVDSLQAKGRYSFTFDEIEQHFNLGYESLRKSLNRLAKKKRIVLVRDKFYVIVPPEYSVPGILPAHLFIDEFMRYMNKPYYIALQSAAALHGAAHQQPQVFQVMTIKPTHRPIGVKGLKIQFYYKSELLEPGISKEKSDTGYIQVSDAALTAVDLILFERRVGGLVRVVEIMEELIENINPDQFRNVLSNNLPVSSLQRLGFMLDRILGNASLSSCVQSVLKEKRLFRVPLDRSMEKTGKPVDSKWKVIMNADQVEGYKKI